LIFFADDEPLEPLEPLEPELLSDPHPAATRAAAARTGRMR
jgi:hypothetical protein